MILAARAHHVRAFATVTNTPYKNGPFSHTVVSDILRSPRLEQRQISALLVLVARRRLAGIDLDWEGLRPGDRIPFATFVALLAQALHQRHAQLSLAVVAKTSDPGHSAQQRAYDYRQLGSAVDEFKLMTYGYHGPWSAPGPETPIAWVDRVLAFAETQVAPGKIYVGVPFYGCLWNGGHGVELTSHVAADLASTWPTRLRREPSSFEA